MNEYKDPLEAELGAWSPLPVSPELQTRIGRALAPRRRLGQRPVLMVTGALAAGLLATLVLWRDRLLPVVPSVPAAVAVHAPAKPEPAPSVLQYSLAYGRSTESLEGLLSRHARHQPLTSHTPGEPAYGLNSRTLSPLDR